VINQFSHLKDLLIQGTNLLPIIAFIFVNLFPGQVLAFSDQTDLGHRPLVFIRDPSLAGHAIVGIEAFRNYNTAGDLLNSPASQIPEAALPLTAGMAIRVLATAYSSTVDQTDGDPFTTASGTRVHQGTLAANFLPFGTRVRIGDTIYIVEDRMNSRYNGLYVVDLWFPNRAAALQYGVRVVPMEIVSLP